MRSFAYNWCRIKSLWEGRGPARARPCPDKEGSQATCPHPEIQRGWTPLTRLAIQFIQKDIKSWGGKVQLPQVCRSLSMWKKQRSLRQRTKWYSFYRNNILFQPDAAINFSWTESTTTVEIFEFKHVLKVQGRRRRGAAGACAPALSKVGGTSGFEPPPPTFGKMKCSNFAISSFFKVKNEKFSWLASLANLALFIFSKLS